MCELYPGEFEAMEHNGRMDAIEPSDKLSKKEIDTMLNALADGEDFPEEQPVKDELISRRAVWDEMQRLWGTSGDIYIPYLMHKEMDISISECQKAYNIAMEYLKNKSKLKG